MIEVGEMEQAVNNIKCISHGNGQNPGTIPHANAGVLRTAPVRFALHEVLLTGGYM
jgi:hypothetical protein